MKPDAQKRINAWFARFENRMDDRVPFIIAETATEFFQDTFQKEAWDGVPWPGLSTKYADKKTRGAGRILIAGSALLNSIRPDQVSATRIVISAGNSKVNYARAHNEGLRIRGIANIKPFTNNNFMGTGSRVQIKAHTRRIDFQMPRRQFMGHSMLLNKIIIKRLKLAFQTK